MKKRVQMLAVMLVFITFASCEGKKEQVNVKEVLNFKEITKGEIIDDTIQVIDKILSQVTIEGDSLNGVLVYQPYMRDGKIGVINGKKNKNGDFSVKFNYVMEASSFIDSLIISVEPNQMIVKEYWDKDLAPKKTHYINKDYQCTLKVTENNVLYKYLQPWSFEDYKVK